MIIDFHTHTFPAKASKKIVDSLAQKSLTVPFTNGSNQDLIESMKKANITYSVNLPVMTNTEQCEKLNKKFIEQKDELFKQGIIQFGGMHPDYTDYKEILDLLKENGIKGIKLHPAYQNISLSDPKFLDIISYADSLGLIIITHAGWDIGIYDKNYCSVDDVLKVYNTIHPKKFVLAHMGNWAAWDEVEEKLCGLPIYFDTAFSLGKIYELEQYKGQCPWKSNLNNEDFIRIIRKHGVNKILFATDSPWADQKEYVDIIQTMNLSQEEKDCILYKNALNLLEL